MPLKDSDVQAIISDEKSESYMKNTLIGAFSDEIITSPFFNLSGANIYLFSPSL
jgi:hypothetical protein